MGAPDPGLLSRRHTASTRVHVWTSKPDGHESWRWTGTRQERIARDPGRAEVSLIGPLDPDVPDLSMEWVEASGTRRTPLRRARPGSAHSAGRGP